MFTKKRRKEMKRMHLHVSVEDLNQSIGFYSALFGTQPSVVKTDYAKWMLEDPRINFAISMRGAKPGLDHLGIQVDKPEELESLRLHMKQADLALFDEGETTCCYANSEKSWVKDPSGIAWETYHYGRGQNIQRKGSR
jgi:catechol-2,3-dioxygenase